MFFQAHRRIAFVVGVKDYEHLRPLKWSANDANEIARQLELRGFHVIRAIEPKDTNWDALKAKVEEFLGLAQKYDLGLFYFAGHGIQHTADPYLFARDAEYGHVNGAYNGDRLQRRFRQVMPRHQQGDSDPGRMPGTARSCASAGATPASLQEVKEGVAGGWGFAPGSAESSKRSNRESPKRERIRARRQPGLHRLRLRQQCEIA